MKKEVEWIVLTAVLALLVVLAVYSPEVSLSPGCALLPTAPTNFVASEYISNERVLCSAVKLSWTKSYDPCGLGIDHYELYRDGIFLRNVFSSSNAVIGIIDNDRILGNMFYNYDLAAVGENGVVSDAVSAGITTPMCQPKYSDAIKVNVLLVKFADHPVEPFSKEYARSVIFDYPYSLKKWAEEVSYGVNTLQGDVLGWYTLSGTTSDYCNSVGADGLGSECISGFSAIESEAKALAGANIDEGSTDKFIYVISGMSSCGYGGDSIRVSAQNCFLNEKIGHELAHDFGLRHAASWQSCLVSENLDSPSGGACSVGEYQDSYDIMGQGYNLNSYNREKAGYISQEQVFSVYQSGYYLIDALDVDSSGIKQLRIPLAQFGEMPKTMYFLEYRKPIGIDGLSPPPSYVGANPTVEDGVQIRLHRDRFLEFSNTIDTIYVPMTIKEGSDFYDPYRGIEVSVVERLGNQIKVYVDLDALDTTLPSVQITSPSSGSTFSGPFGVTATASDNRNINRVEYYVDGNKFAQSSSSPSYSATISVAVLVAGSHSLVAKAFDGAGNVGVSSSRTINVQHPPGYIPPTLEVEKLVAFDAAEDDSFGNSVAVEGDLLVVGAHKDSNAEGSSAGATYIYRKNGQVWELEEKVYPTGTDLAALDSFGTKVLIDEGIIFVSTLRGDVSSQATNRGTIFVYEYDDTTWMKKQKIFASDHNLNDYFGSSFDVEGNRMVVGAYNNGDAGESSGSAYVFEYEGGAWVEKQKLVASDAEAGDLFGRSVSIKGDFIVVGADGEDTLGSSAGSVYVFGYNPSTQQWTQKQKLLASGGKASDGFGSSVDIRGDFVIVGAYGVNTYTGAAYVFKYANNQWSQSQKIVPSDISAGDRFGVSVSLFNNRIVIGSSYDDDAGINSGSAYVYEYNGNSWVQTKKLLSSDVSTARLFGSDVFLDSYIVVVGASFESEVLYKAGSAFVYNILDGSLCSTSGDCNDGLFCNGVEQCVSGKCARGTSPLVDDGIGCTTDFCDESNNIIVNAPDDGLCDNGLYCDGLEICNVQLDCLSGVPPNCGGEGECMVCDEFLKSCIYDESSCFVETCAELGGDICSSGEVCQGNLLVASDSTNCCSVTCDPVSLCGNGLPDVDEDCDGTNLGGDTCMTLGFDDGILACTSSCTFDTSSCTTSGGSGNYDTSYSEGDGVNNGNPGGLNTESDGVGGWVAITSAPQSTNSWSSAQQIPFAFEFFGDSVTQFRVSQNGLIIFDTSSTTIPGDSVENTNLPTSLLPDKTIVCFWDRFTANPPTGTNDKVYTKTFGTAPNRQLWIEWSSFEYGSLGSTFNAFACVLEEGTNKVYAVDTNYNTGSVSSTVGLQKDSLTAVQYGDQNIDFGTGNVYNYNNDYYEFAPSGGTGGCTLNSQCDDGAFCTTDTCNLATGVCSNTAVNVNDGVSCTIDSCDETNNVIVHAPNNLYCSNLDGQYCNGAEICNVASGCVAGTSPVINDGISCTADSCNEATDTIVHAPITQCILASDGCCPSGCTSSNDNDCTAPVTYTLSVSKTGSGTVSSTPAGINCGTDCSENYASGTSVSLTATANSGYMFSGWGGACSGTGSCAVSMTSAKTVSATFTLTQTTDPYVVINSPQSGESVSGIVSVSISASSPSGIKVVTFYVDSARKKYWTSWINPSSYSWDTSSYASGSHSLKANACNYLGVCKDTVIQVNVNNVGLSPPSTGGFWEWIKGRFGFG